MDEGTYRAKKLKMLESNKDKEITLAEKCDQILLWSKKILKVWVETLEYRYNTQEAKKSKTGR
jgi:hypothetical protein